MESAVLFISPDSAQAENVTEMLRPATLGLDHAACLADARIMLAKHPYRVILTEAELPDAVWTDVIDLTYDLGVFPAIIVTRLTADDVFWAEVLNLGAYDLLAQPFDEREVRRILANACSQAVMKPPRKETAKLRSIPASL
jgi:DNA-binding NtrC family response regulator